MKHEKQFVYLKNAIQNDKLHHSYIFYGPAGSGKFEFAIFFAQYLQCKNREETGPCGKCKNCLVNKGQFVIDSYILDLGKDEAIKIEEINSIKNKVDHSSVSGNRKIVIVNNAQNMTREAREVLLKTLEEPADNASIILITDELNSLPKTILSRCPRIYFSKDQGNFLKQIEDIVSSGGLDDSFDSGEILEIISEFSSLVLGESLFDRMILAKKFSDNKDCKKIVRIWLLILYKLLLRKEELLSSEDDDIGSLQNLEKNLSYDRILALTDKVLQLLNNLETNISKRILFEDFVLSL